jgi:hypothetical protein
MHMRHFNTITSLCVTSLLALSPSLADAKRPPRFSDFTPMPASAGPTSDESMPMTLGNPAFEQRSIADRQTQLAEGIPNSGNWDMNTLNETGDCSDDDRGRFLFTVGLPGSLVITDTNGIVSVDGRNTSNLPAFKGTDYQRPEDLQIQRVRGREYLYVATTTTHEFYRLDLRNQVISVFADRNTIDLATGLPVGSAFSNPDNLAADHEGNLYVIEDRNGGVDNDIWFAADLNQDGDLLGPGEGLARWATNGTVGSEFTGLYFDPFNKRRAWVNIQHPSSQNDRTIEITIAKPGL